MRLLTVKDRYRFYGGWDEVVARLKDRFPDAKDHIVLIRSRRIHLTARRLTDSMLWPLTRPPLSSPLPSLDRYPRGAVQSMVISFLRLARLLDPVLSRPARRNIDRTVEDVLASLTDNVR